MVGLAQKKEADVVGCVIKEAGSERLLFSGDHRPAHLFFVSYFWFRHKLMADEPSNAVWGTALLASQKALLDAENRFGFVFNPRLFMYAEDNDFSMRMMELDYKIYFASRALVYHKHSDSCVNQKYDNSFLLYYATRNTILVARQHLSLLWLGLFFVYYPAVRIKDVLLRFIQGRSREASNILEGLWDGVRNVQGKWKKH
jgi:GT2 family glycosyltransferase